MALINSIGERFGLRIVPGANSFLVLPNDISRAGALSTILDPAGPVQNARVPGSPRSPGGALGSPRVPRRSLSISRSFMGGDDTDAGAHDFVLVLSADERLLSRVGEQENGSAETVSTGLGSSEARWRVERGDVRAVLDGLAGTQ
jgi:hypothetical protein